MYCSNCGAKLSESASFCENCGTRVIADSYTSNENMSVDPGAPAQNGGFQPVNYNGFDVMKRVFSSPLALTVCIVNTVGNVISLLQSGLNIISVLYTIGFWIIYANAKSQKEPLKQGGYKLVAVLLKIQYVINYVLIGILGAFGCLFGFFAATMREEFYDGVIEGIEDVLEANEQLRAEFEEIFSVVIAKLNINAFAYDFASFAAYVIVALIIIAIVVLLIYNLCFVKHFTQYAKSLSDSFAVGKVQVYNGSFAARCLAYGIIAAVFTFLPTVASFGEAPFSTLSAGCTAAIPFLIYALVNSAKSH